MSHDRVQMIRDRLTRAFQPTRLEIEDESHKHIGHAGAASGAGHFIVTIHAPDLEDKTRLQRHRLIYDALADMMETEIHALRIRS